MAIQCTVTNHNPPAFTPPVQLTGTGTILTTLTVSVHAPPVPVGAYSPQTTSAKVGISQADFDALHTNVLHGPTTVEISCAADNKTITGFRSYPAFPQVAS